MTQANVLDLLLALPISQAQVEEITERVNNELLEREAMTEFAQKILLAVDLLIGVTGCKANFLTVAPRLVVFPINLSPHKNLPKGTMVFERRSSRGPFTPHGDSSEQI
jgi:hypothetical protein